MSFSLEDMSARALGVDGNKVDLSTQEGAQKATTTIDAAIKKVSEQRSKMGAIQNRLEHTIANLDTAAENTQGSFWLHRAVYWYFNRALCRKISTVAVARAGKDTAGLR